MTAIEKSPWQRGHDDGLAGKPGPAIPKADATWAERLYSSGWSRGVEARKQG